jgi:hypothetical protein
MYMFTYWIHGGSDEWEYIFIVVPKDGLHPETQLFILCSHSIREIEDPYPRPMRLKDTPPCKDTVWKIRNKYSPK